MPVNSKCLVSLLSSFAVFVRLDIGIRDFLGRGSLLSNHQFVFTAAASGVQQPGFSSSFVIGVKGLKDFCYNDSSCNKEGATF